MKFSTYVGGAGYDAAVDVDLDPAGRAVLAGTTQSSNFPLRGAIQTSLLGPSDAFALVLSADGRTLDFSTYFGGSGADGAVGAIVDAMGRIVFAGFTDSTDLPVTGAFQATPGGNRDGFVARVDPSLSMLVNASYLGGSGADRVEWIRADGRGGALVVGDTASSDLPTVNAFQPTYSGGAADAYVANVDAGFALHFATYLGGARDDYGYGLHPGPCGTELVATGATNSTDFPVRNPVQPLLGGDSDAWVARFLADGTLVESTFVGGSLLDVGFSAFFAPAGDIYAFGATTSADFPSVNPFQTTGEGLMVRIQGAPGCVVPPAIGNTLSAVKSGPARDLHLQWQDVTPCVRDYPVYADPDKGGGFSTWFGSALDGLTGLIAPQPSDPLRLFRVAARSPCGESAR